jgi:hypothetical protein
MTFINTGRPKTMPAAPILASDTHALALHHLLYVQSPEVRRGDVVAIGGDETYGPPNSYWVDGAMAKTINGASLSPIS